MDFHLAVPVAESDSVARDRAVSYLTQRGYKLAAPTPELRLRRGHSWLTPLSLTPRGWGANVAVTFTEGPGATHVEATWDICTSGQMITEREMEFWEHEVEGLRVSLREGATPADGPATSGILRENVGAIAVAFFVGLGSIIVAGLLGLPVPAAVPVGCTIATIATMSFLRFRRS